MALPFYMTMVGDKTGNIEGFNSKVGHETEIQCHALEQRLYRPYNPETGQPTGVRIHGAVKVTKSFDKASPLLFHVLATGENLSEVVMKFFRIDPSGEEVNYYTITLTNATIVEIKPIMLNHFDEQMSRYDHMEEVHITYEKVEWRWEPDGISAVDEAGA